MGPRPVWDLFTSKFLPRPLYPTAASSCLPPACDHIKIRPPGPRSCSVNSQSSPIARAIPILIRPLRTVHQDLHGTPNFGRVLAYANFRNLIKKIFNNLPDFRFVGNSIPHHFYILWTCWHDPFPNLKAEKKQKMEYQTSAHILRCNLKWQKSTEVF